MNMPHFYKPSISTGIYGSYTVFLEFSNLEEKCAEIEISGQAGGRQMVEQMKKHRLPKVNFSTITIPSSISSKPKDQQMIAFAGMYKNLLFKNQTKRPHLGGWLFLSCKNYKRTKHAKVSSPEELGYKIIGPKYYGDPDYERTAVKHIRDGTVVIKSCVGKTGSYYVEIELENTSNQPITITFPRGQVFEQDRFRAVQNLGLKGFYTKGDVPSDPQDVIMTNKEISITIPANKTVTKQFEAFCLDSNYSSPGGQSMNMCPLISEASVINDDQGAVWKDVGDLY